MTLTADRLMVAAAEEVATMAADLRRIEAALAPDLGRLGASSAVLQGVDALMQRMEALAAVLVVAAPELPPTTLPGAETMIARVRLSRLTDRLLGHAATGGDTGAVELF